MKRFAIYRISQTDVKGWDTFDSAVVIAPSASVARTVHPKSIWWGETTYITKEDTNNWTDNPDKVVVEYLGEAHPDFVEIKVVCASYNAG